MKNILIAVACRNASGMADMPVFFVSVTSEEYSEGIHYDRAEALARDERYEPPFLCFDDAEHPHILAAVKELNLVPQVVAVDFTDGQIHSVRCDAGEIKMVCFDTSATQEHFGAEVDAPLGENGSILKCRAYVQLADIDPGLERARG